jgi:hypothetical protein
VGEVVEKFSYTPVFVAMGMLHVIALIIVHTMVKGPVVAPTTTALTNAG